MAGDDKLKALEGLWKGSSDETWRCGGKCQC